MAERQRPRARKKNVTENSKGIQRRGEGVGGSKIGGSFFGQKQNGTAGQSGLDRLKDLSEHLDDEGPKRSGTGGAGRQNQGARGVLSGGMGGGRGRAGNGGCLRMILIIVFIFVVGSLLLDFFGGRDQNDTGLSVPAATAQTASVQDVISAGGGSQTGWAVEANTGEAVSEEVSGEAREKLTTIKGDGTDQVTIMVYMCGTDLESQSAMATNDLNEMLAATGSENVNVLIYTGGCNRWRNNVISSKVNQIYRIHNGSFDCVVSDDGAKRMTDPDTLEAFIKWANQNYPANRRELIFWDHGSGSVQGYGYDEKYSSKPPMSLAQINRALTNAGVTFDFIGFDACLMATAETAQMLGDDADYLIASEETEPGVGWYYTDWLTAFSADTAMPTLEVGKLITDSFVTTCQKQTPGQETTLSVTDLAEFSSTFPAAMGAFSRSTTDLIGNGGYSQVSKARSMSKEFARGNKLDQVDLIHFSALMNTDESLALADMLRSAIKYNRTSRGVANAYGLSVYFPYTSFRSVDSAANIFSNIGFAQDYMTLFQRFAQMQASGQAVAGGYSSPSSSLFGSSGQSSSGSYGYEMSGEDMLEILGLLLGGRLKDAGQVGDLTEETARFLTGTSLSADEVLETVSKDRVENEDLRWKEDASGNPVLTLSEAKWANISRVDLAMFYDDGEGYIELGEDNLYDWDADGNLVPELDRTWLAIDGQPVAYYHRETLDVSDDEYSIRGTVPVLLNDKRAELIVVFDQDHEDGYIAGATYTYEDSDAVAKNLSGLSKGDRIDFLAGYYAYDGTFRDNYKIGDPYTVDDPEAIEISNVDVGDGDVSIVYCLTDIFGQEFWTEPLVR